MSVFLLILGSLLVTDLAWWYISDRLLRLKAFRGRKWRIANGIFLGAQFFGLAAIIGGRALGFRLEFPTLVMTAIYLWHLLILPLLLGLGVLALPFWLAFRLLRRKMKNKTPAASALENTQTRRQFLGTAAAVTPPLLNFALTGFSQRQIEQFRVRQLTVRIRGLPADLHGLTIAHVSDLHVGPFTSERVIRQVAERVNALRADVALLTGDLINSKLTELPPGTDFVRSLDVPNGVFMIEGNHDLFEGREAFAQGVHAAGIRLLVNESQTVIFRGQPVQLLGLRWGGPGENPHSSSDVEIAASMQELLRERTAGAFPILLAHHPHGFDAAVRAGLPLTLSGHTHGGQLMLNSQVGAGPVLFRYWSGLYRQEESQLVVSNSVGNWFPLRTAAPAEIIHLTLCRE